MALIPFACALRSGAVYRADTVPEHGDLSDADREDGGDLGNGCPKGRIAGGEVDNLEVRRWRFALLAGRNPDREGAS